MKQDSIIKLALVLTIITAVSATGLTFVDSTTKPLIEAYKQKVRQEAIKEVLPAIADGMAEPVIENEKVLYYMGYRDKNKKIHAGYVLSVIGKGYQSDIETMVGVDLSGKIVAVKILSQLETPGLGTRLEEINPGQERPWFQVQFNGKHMKELMVDKDGGSIDSITGATISSRAVALSIKKGIRDLREKIGGFPKE